MTLNGILALILHYFAEFGSFQTRYVKMVEDVVVKKFTFAISSPGEFLIDSGARMEQTYRQTGRRSVICNVASGRADRVKIFTYAKTKITRRS